VTPLWRVNGHTTSPGTLAEAVARGESTAGHLQSPAIMPRGSLAGHLFTDQPLMSLNWSMSQQLDPLRPSPTIQAQPGPNVGPFHWDNRCLRVGEIKRLFTFPDEFELVGTRSSIQAQLRQFRATAAGREGSGKGACNNELIARYRAPAGFLATPHQAVT
jgi:hypothetical protein